MTTPNTYAGDLVATGLKLGFVVGRFNSLISEQLLQGALDGFVRHGGDIDDADVAWVPGAFDLPLVARRMAAAGKYDAVVALGCVIRGGTPHFEYVSNQVSRGIAQASWDHDVPVTFGVLTTDTIQQAIERAGTKAGNKGYDAATAAIEMARLLVKLPRAEA